MSSAWHICRVQDSHLDRDHRISMARASSWITPARTPNCCLRSLPRAALVSSTFTIRTADADAKD